MAVIHLAVSAFLLICVVLDGGGGVVRGYQTLMSGFALSDAEYKYNMGEGYVFFEIIRPESIAYTYKLTPGTFSPVWNNTYKSIGLVPTDPVVGCGYLRNADQLMGQVALVERGECSFVSKAVRAQEAGAIGIIITESSSRDNDEIYLSMVNDVTHRSVRIPSGYLLGVNGYLIRKALREAHLSMATINIPLNISAIPVHQLHQPPWLVW